MGVAVLNHFDEARIVFSCPRGIGNVRRQDHILDFLFRWCIEVLPLKLTVDLAGADAQKEGLFGLSEVFFQQTHGLRRNGVDADIITAIKFLIARGFFDGRFLLLRREIGLVDMGVGLVLKTAEQSAVVMLLQDVRECFLVGIVLSADVGEFVHAIGVGVASGEDGGPAGRASRRGTKHVVELDAFACKGVQAWGLDAGIAVCCKVFAEVVPDDFNHVGF